MSNNEATTGLVPCSFIGVVWQSAARTRHRLQRHYNFRGLSV